MAQEYSTAGDYGLKTLHEPKDAIVDIVFVHGLTGNRETTWTFKPTRQFWPQKFLPEDLPNAHIITFGYDGDIVGALKVAGSNTLRDHGKTLAHELAVSRKRSRSNHRPLIFVAHSLGGLVTEQALLVCRGSAQQYYKDVLDSTAAIAFMGTPHLGSNKAAWALPLTRLANVLRTANKEIVQALAPGSEMLANLQQEFHSMLEDYRQNYNKTIEMFCFYEELEVTGVGKIVSDQSAILASCPNRSIHGNHMQMTRFNSPQDPGYMAVSNQLWIWVDGIESQQAPVPVEAGNRSSRSGYMIQSGGGPVMLGNMSAGRDFTFNNNIRH
ncbi:hypothetical protein N7447_001693 [Penicillium robsamsonii]|uniref:uncharacterized protein n=1 Tax=Penicillium robsamsonii TaxID=1792511 RepID=UPI0025489022|nr:uncharacterized protein N7447_001693 [Penicillium robsamsonii]KAJ5835667.1 hypothetical protein N7447_001693 [Penicillium robsamsonii]